MSDRFPTIFNVLAGIYGDTETVQAMAINVDQRLDGLTIDEDRPLHQMLTNLIWDWMPGGGTAAIAAERIIETLKSSRLDIIQNILFKYYGKCASIESLASFVDDLPINGENRKGLVELILSWTMCDHASADNAVADIINALTDNSMIDNREN